MFDDPDAAEAAFYQAFQDADLEAMSRVWVEHDGAACIHPMGPRLQGRLAVMDSWQQIFGARKPMQVRLSHVHKTVQEDLAVHVLHENILVASSESGRENLVVATNVYQRTTDGWRMMLHHASLTPASMQQEVPSISKAVH